MALAGQTAAVVTRSGPTYLAMAWKRRLIPTLLILAAAGAAIQPLRSYDLWWHLASGRYMLAEGRIPTADPFSFTRAGVSWLDHEWLFQLLVYGGYSAGNWLFLLLGTVALSVTTYGLLSDCLSSHCKNSGAGWLLLALSLAGARFRFDFRPEMFSYLFLAALVAILLRSRLPGRHAVVWLLFPLFAVWANLHPGAVLGAAVLFVWLVGEWIQDRVRPEATPRTPGGAGLALASVTGLLLNPGGWRLLAVPVEIRAIVLSGHAPNQEWFPPTFADFPLFFASVVVACLVILGSLATTVIFGRLGKPGGLHGESAAKGTYEEAGGERSVLSRLCEMDWAPVLVLALMAWMGFQQLRNIGFFFLFLPLALGQPLANLLERGRVPASATRLLGGATLVLLIPVFLYRTPVRSEGQFVARVAPAGAVSYLEQRHLGERLFNDVKFGGYLIWMRYPRHRVFIDGRNEIYDSLLAEIFGSLGSWARWEAMLDRHGIDAAMLRRGQIQAVEYPPASPGAAPRREMRAFSAAYFQASHWALVYWDDQAVIFVRREGAASSGLLEGEYRIINPDDVPHLLQQIRQGQVRLEDALREAERKLWEDPGCVTALELREQLVAMQHGAGS